MKTSDFRFDLPEELIAQRPSEVRGRDRLLVLDRRTGQTLDRDFGDIVFNLIEYNVFSKTENDRREDFADIYTFDDAFVKPFRPSRPTKRRASLA